MYNLRIADHHTYFVGCDVWGFSVWAHNDYRAYQGYFLELGTQGVTLKNGGTLHAYAGGPFKPNPTRPTAVPVLRNIFDQIVKPAVAKGNVPVQAPQPFITDMKAVFGSNISDSQIQTAWEKAISASSSDGRRGHDFSVLGQAGEAEMVKVLTGPKYHLTYVGSLQNRCGNGVDGVFLSQDKTTLYIVEAKASNGSDFGLSDEQSNYGPRRYAQRKVTQAIAQTGPWANNPQTLWEGKTISAKDAAVKLQALLDSHKGTGAVVGLKVEVPCNNDVPIEAMVRVKKGNSREWDSSVWNP